TADPRCRRKRNTRYETSQRKSQTEPEHFAPPRVASESRHRPAGPWPFDDNAAEGERSPAACRKDDHSRQTGQLACPAAIAGLPIEGSRRQESIRDDRASVCRPKRWV